MGCQVSILDKVIFVQNEYNQRKLLYFVYRHTAELSKTDFQSQFYVPKMIWILFLKFLFLRSTYFLKWYLIFDDSTQCLFTKYNNFLGVCWCLDKNIFNFNPSFENLTTHTAILDIIPFQKIKVPQQNFTLAESFYNFKYGSSIIMSKVSQKISVMKT